MNAKVKETIKKPIKPVIKEAKTDHAPYRGHVGWYVGGFLLALVLFGVGAFLAHKGTYMGWEVTLFHQINGWPDSLRIFFLIVTIVPSTSLWIGFIAMVITFLLRMYRLTWRLSVALVGGSVAGYIAKEVVGRARPVELLTDAHVRIHETGMGFPSGHTLVITIVMLMLVPYTSRRWAWVLLIPIALMGLARIYLGVHVPLDIIGGFALGLGVVSFLRILPQSVKVFCRLD